MNLLYSIPYVVLLFIVYVLYLNEQGSVIILKKRKNCSIVILLLLILFFGLRGHEYSDFSTYYPRFEYMETLGKLKFEGFYEVGQHEFGFVLFSSFIKTIWDNYFFWIFVNSVIDLVVLYVTFKRYSLSASLSFLLFLLYFGISMEFNLLRQMKAIDMFLLSIPYIENKNFKKFILFNAIGFTFHVTAVMYFPMYFILNKTFPKGFIWGAFAFVNFIYLFGIHFSSEVISFVSNSVEVDKFNMKLALYTDVGSESYKLSIGYFDRTLTFVLVVLLYKKLFLYRKYNRILCNCYILYYIFFYFFYDYKVFTERVPVIFVFSIWILYPYIFKMFSPKNTNYLFILIMTIGLAKVVVQNSKIVAKYENVITGVSSYEKRLMDLNNYSKTIQK